MGFYKVGCKIMPAHFRRAVISLMMIVAVVMSFLPTGQREKAYANNPEKNSFAKYSSVFLSSRWYRADGQDGQLGTLDVLKRFMATDDKWSYITDQGQISKIKNLGTSVQSTLNMNMGTTGKALMFDGTVAVAPWMSWGSTWGCQNSPEFMAAVKSSAHASINAGVTSFQFDDWAGNQSLNSYGICFCSYCMAGFRDYLQINYTTSQLSSWGISDIANFNYKAFLQQSLGIYTNSDYSSKRSQTPLNTKFLEYQKQVVRKFHIDLRTDLEAYAGKPIIYSCNNSGFLTSYNDSSKIFAHDLFDYSVGETSDAGLGLSYIVTAGTISSSLGKPFVISPLTQDKNVGRYGLAAAYAVGQYYLVPWDIWLHDSVRYFCDTNDYADMFHFIRQYDYLFDGYEVPAKAGLLFKWTSMDKTQFSNQSMSLFSAGVPFRDLVTNVEQPTYSLDAEKLKGLSYIVAHSPVSSLPPADQQVITDSKIPVISPSEMTSIWLSQNSSVSVSGNTNVYATLRAKTNNINAPKVVHLLNRNMTDVSNTTVTIKDTDFFGSDGINGDINAVLYAPDKNPVSLPIVDIGNGKHQITVPQLGIWGIIRVSDGNYVSNEIYQLPLPWSGINIGNPVMSGSATFENNKITLKSTGKGLNTVPTGDTGYADQISYAYQNIGASQTQDDCITTKLISQSNTGSLCEMGVMVRESPASNAKFVSLSYEQGSGLNLKWRDIDNITTGSISLGNCSLPIYIKLERNGDVYRAYKSSDGINWGTSLGNHSISFVKKVGGVYTASNSGGIENIACFNVQDLNTPNYVIENPKIIMNGSVATGAYEFDIKNEAQKTQRGKIIVALYNADNMLEQFACNDRNLPEGVTDKVKGAFRLPSNTTGYYIKIYVWDSFNQSTGMQLCSNVVKLSY